jgi:transcriptional regulator with XRE-family HTH domain
MRPLEQVCPYCGREPHFLAYKSRPGHCSHCQGWLGTVKGAKESPITDPKDSKIAYQIWSAKTVYEWVGAAQLLSTPITRVEMAGITSAVIQRYAEGDVKEFARLTGICRDYFYSWQSGKHVPRLDYLLKICFALGLSLTGLVRGQFTAQDSPLSAERLSRKEKERKTARRSVPQVVQMLEAALNEDPPSSLSDLAERFGYKDAESLRYISNTLCREITARRRAWEKLNGKLVYPTKRICDDGTIQRTLELALTRDCPPAVDQIAADLGYKSTCSLYLRFPHFCYQITARRREYVDRCLSGIRPTLDVALKEEPPPSLAEVLRRVRPNSYRLVRKSFPELIDAIRARHMEWTAVCEEQTRLKLLAALEEVPPRSLKLIMNLYGYNRTTLYKKCGDLCRKISARYAAYQRQQGAERKKAFKEQVRKVVVKLRESGVSPSAGRVAKSLENPVIKQLSALNEILNELKIELV